MLRHISVDSKKNRIFVLVIGSLNVKDEQAKLRCTTTLILSGGKKILVDPGSLSQRGLLLDAFSKFNISHKSGFSGKLTRKDIDIVINTHSHRDHAANNEVFPSSKIYGPHKIAKLRAILPKGVEVIRTPGHTKGHMSVTVDNAYSYWWSDKKRLFIEKKCGSTVIAGDAIASSSDVMADKVLPNAVDKKGALEIQKRLSTSFNYVIPGHGDGFMVSELDPYMIRGDSWFIDRVSHEKSFTRDRTLGDYFEEIRKRIDYSPPSFQPGQKVLDLGCGYGAALAEIAQIVYGGYCTRKNCFKHADPYYTDSLISLVNPPCTFINEDGEYCGKLVKTGRVVGVDISDESIRKAHGRLSRGVVKRDSRFRIDVIKKDSKLDLENIRENDEELDKKSIVLYETDMLDLTAMPTNYFDIILAIQSFQYCHNPIYAISELLSVMKPRAIAYIVASNPLYLLDERLDPAVEHALREGVKKRESTIKLLKRLNLPNKYYLSEFLKEFVPEIEIIPGQKGKRPEHAIMIKHKDVPRDRLLKQFTWDFAIYPSNRVIPFYIKHF